MTGKQLLPSTPMRTALAAEAAVVAERPSAETEIEAVITHALTAEEAKRPRRYATSSGSRQSTRA